MAGQEPQLSAELIDELTEAVVKADEPAGRAQVIADVLHEVDEVVKWRHQPHPGSEEEQSLTRLVNAAATHQHDMNHLNDITDRHDGTHSAPAHHERSTHDERSPKNERSATNERAAVQRSRLRRAVRWLRHHS